MGGKLPLAASALNDGLVVFCRVGFGCSALTGTSLSPDIGRAFHHLCPMAVCVFNTGNGTDKATQHQQVAVAFCQGSASICGGVPMREPFNGRATRLRLGCAAS